MKPLLPAIVITCIGAGMAQAQSGITTYGSFDGGVRYIEGINAANEKKLSVGSNGTYNSNRLGFIGVEDLGRGWNVHFNLETGFNTGTGALESTTGSAVSGTAALFNRVAMVGIGSPWGDLDFGQLYSVAFRTAADYDPFAYNYPAINPITGIVAGNAVSQGTGGSRFHNNIQYTGKFGPITVRAEHSLGEVAGAKSVNSSTAGAVTYEDGPLVLGAAYTSRKLATTGGIFTGATAVAEPPAIAGQSAATAASPTYDDRAWTAGAAYQISALRFSGGYNSERLNGALNTTVAGLPLTPATGDTRVRVGWAGLAWDITPILKVTGGWFQTKVDTPVAAAAGAASGTNGKKNLYILSASYFFSKRTNAYAEIDRTRLSGNQILGFGGPVTESRSTGVSMGINHTF